MELQIIRQEALDNLKKSYRKNISLYANEKEEWLNSFFYRNGIKRPIIPSHIEIEDIELKQGNIASLDLDNSIILHEQLKDKLNPVIATDKRLWIALSHTKFYSYMQSRWTVENKLDEKGENGTVSGRFFMDRGFFRNGISRLYWIAELTYDKALDDPYEYTRYLISKQDLINQVDGRSLCRNRQILKTSLKVLKAAEPLTETQQRLYFEKLCKFGGITVLDALPVDELKTVCEKAMTEAQKLKRITNGCTIAVTNLLTGINEYFEVRKGKAYKNEKILKSVPENLFRLTIGKTLEIENTQYKLVGIK